MRAALTAVFLIFTLNLSLSAAEFPPKELVNLKVLPSDTTPRQLIGVMRGFAGGLGVRCWYCHVGEEGQDLSEFDFQSDEKPTKLKAREMMRMVQAINSQHLANLTERSDPPIEINCATCHHGLTKPVTLQDELLKTYDDGGLDAVVLQYRELREQFYGGWSYDFSTRSLNTVAETLGRRGNLEDGIAVQKMNIEFNPDEPFTFTLLGQLHERNNQIREAIQAWETAQRLLPAEDAFIQSTLKRLKEKQEGAE